MLVFVLDTLQRAERIALAGPSLGEFGAADQVVDASQHLVEARIDIIDIHADRDAVVACDAGGAGDGGRVVSVDMQHPRARNLLRSDVRGVERQTIRAMPEDGALAGGLVDDDVGALVGATGADLDVFKIDEPASRRLAIWMRPRSSSPTAPMYLVRRPSLPQVASALATWPPGLRISRSKATLPPSSGYFGTSRSVSVALRPTPTRSKAGVSLVVNGAQDGIDQQTVLLAPD